MAVYFFFFNDTATTEIYTLSLHDALPISRRRRLAYESDDAGWSWRYPDSRVPKNARQSLARSRIRSSSFRWLGSVRIELNRPDRARQCWPTMAFSSTVMLGNRWTVWKVRAMPSRVIWLGFSPTMLSPRKTTSPSSGAYKPVITLNTVLL